MGGVGKSPMVAHLAERLREAGRNPAILTRGYKRKSAEPIVLIPRGEMASLDLTGDEAQMFLRAGDAHVGIGRSRYDVGLQMEQRFAPGRVSARRRFPASPASPPARYCLDRWAESLRRRCVSAGTQPRARATVLAAPPPWW